MREMHEMRVQTRRAMGVPGAARGQMLVVFALALSVFLGAALLGVDLAHLRSEVERAQHAANAAALAGVSFMPNFQPQAFYRAREEATKNGFTTSAASAITVTPETVAGRNYRLHVSISAPVPLFFGRVFGLGRKQITVSATAEFLPPLQMGSPDYVLGFPRFPSYLTPARSPQNFVLTQNGGYTWKENGDPYNPFFESVNNYGMGAAVNDGQANPCAVDPFTCPQTSTQPPIVNQLANSGASFHGYKYVIYVPASGPYLLKIFDPFTSVNYNAIARCWDVGRMGASSAAQGAQTNAQGVRTNCSATTVAAPNPPRAPEDIKPVFTGGGCILGTQGGGCRDENIQSQLQTEFHSTATDHPLLGNPLQFSLSGPAQSLLDPALHNPSVTALGVASLDKCAGVTENCVIADPFVAGDDPTHCGTDACAPSSVAYKFVNYAVLHGPAYFELTVASVNPYGTYGEGNNSYGLAVCNASNASGATVDATYTGNDKPLGVQGTSPTYVTSDPVSHDATTGGWNDAACPNPNPPTCPDPRLASPGQCVQIYGEGRLPLYNYLSAGSSLIPLGYIPVDYAGQTLNVDLFDPGDVGSSGADPGSVFGCLTPSVSTSGTAAAQRINTMEVLTPAGDLQCPGGTVASNHIDGHSNTAGTNTQPGSLDYSFSTKPDYAGSGYTATGLAFPTAATPLDVGNGTRPYNGAWVHLKIAVPSTYDRMVNGDGSNNSAFGAYWKVLYRLGGDSTDVTVWTLSVEGSAVHLVNPS